MHHDIKDLESTQEGRIFIVGNGPSLARTPMEMLAGESTMAMNNIHLLFDRTDWRPTYYLHASENINYIRRILDHHSPTITSAITFERIPGLTSVGLNNFVLGNPISLYESLNRYTLNDLQTSDNATILEFWSDDVSKRVFVNHSMLAACQIASYIGYDEIYLIGVDLYPEYTVPYLLFNTSHDPANFSGNIGNYLFQAMHKKILFKSIINALSMKMYQLLIHCGVSRSRLNYKPAHFVENYRDDKKLKGNNYYMHNHNIQHLRSHIIIKRATAEKNIKVYNATLGGRLEIYPRVDFVDLF